MIFVSEVDRELIRVLPRSDRELSIINEIYCFLMNQKQKFKIINYLNLFESAGFKISDESLADYIEIVLKDN